MTQPKNIRLLKKPKRDLGITPKADDAIEPAPPTPFQRPQARISEIRIAGIPWPHMPGAQFLKLLIDGKPLYIPAKATQEAGWVAVQVAPQFICQLTDDDAEAFYAQQVQAAQQQQSAQLWTPDKARKGLVR